MLFARPLTTNQNYLCIKVNDMKKANIAQYFATCNDFIHNARLANSKENNVLLHCFMGLSRSVTIAIAYIMTVTDLGFDDAWRVVRSIRNGARPNLSFQEQLHDFEINQLMLERYRLRKRFPNGNLYAGDRLKCREILKDYKLLLLERLRFNAANEPTVEENVKGADHDNGDENIENEPPKNSVDLSKLTKEQKAQLRKIAKNLRDRQNLIPTNIVLNMDSFHTTFPMPGAVLYEVAVNSGLNRK